MVCQLSVGTKIHFINMSKLVQNNQRKQEDAIEDIVICESQCSQAMNNLIFCTKFILGLTSKIKTCTLDINEQLDGISEIGFTSVPYQIQKSTQNDVIII